MLHSNVLPVSNPPAAAFPLSRKILTAVFWLRAHVLGLSRSAVRKEVLSSDEKNCDWALTWWALADVPKPITPEGEFRMSYSTKQAIYYGEVRDARKTARNTSHMHHGRSMTTVVACKYTPT